MEYFISKRNKILFIEKIFREFDQYRATAFRNQIKFMDNIRQQYKKRNNLSTKQLNIAFKILNQNKKYIKNLELSKKLNQDGKHYLKSV